MALKSADYVKMGFEAAQRGELLSECTLREGSWQRDCWAAGHADGLPKKTLSMALEERRKAAFAHWPQAAAEHGKLLALGMAASDNERRTKRLLRSFNRLVKRYGPARAPATS